MWALPLRCCAAGGKKKALPPPPPPPPQLAELTHRLLFLAAVASSGFHRARARPWLIYDQVRVPAQYIAECVPVSFSRTAPKNCGG